MENTGSPQDGTGIKNSTASAGKLQIRMTHFITYALKSAKYQENLPPKDMPAKFLISTRPPKFLRERQSRDQLFQVLHVAEEEGFQKIVLYSYQHKYQSKVK